MGCPDNDPDASQNNIQWAYDQQSELAAALYSACTTLLTESPKVQLLRSIFYVL